MTYHRHRIRMAKTRSAALVLICGGLIRLTPLPALAASAEGNVPAPSRAFTPRTAAAFYADVHGAGKSAMWKTITNKAAPLVEHLHTLRQAQIASLPMPRALSGFHGSDVAELAVALEGEKILSDLQSSQFDPNSGFLVVLRLIGTRDVNDLIQHGLEAIDKEVPGLRSQIEKSRRRIGAAEVFDVPSEALGEQKLPFTLSCAIGSGKDGTIIALGRLENLQAFLSGKTEGTLRGQINDTLSRRGQFWLYFPVPKDATKSLGAGAAGAGANPMFAGLTQSMDQVRDVNLSLNFGASQVDFELDLGCADGVAAGQMAQGIQGFLGMMQMGAQQNPSSLPPFVGKIKAAADGAIFRLTTAFIVRDVDLAFQNVNRQVAAARPPASIPAPKPEAAATPVPSAPPVEVEFVGFSAEEQESLRTAKVRVLNRSSKPVKELKLTFAYLDESGRKLGEWTRNHSSLTSENLIGGGTTGVVDCLAFNVPSFTKKVAVTLQEATFAGGEKWVSR